MHASIFSGHMGSPNLGRLSLPLLPHAPLVGPGSTPSSFGGYMMFII